MKSAVPLGASCGQPGNTEGFVKKLALVRLPAMSAKRNLLAGLLGGAMLFGLSACRASTTPQAQAETPARRSVTALGRLEPRGRVADISVAGDERLSRILVKEGQLVKEGEILGYLESYESRLAARDRAVTT